MTRPDLDAIEARVGAATPGPCGNAGYPLRGRDGPEVAGPGDALLLTMECRPADDVDATFIAHARSDIPALLAYVRELEATVLTRDEASALRAWLVVVEGHRAFMLARQGSDGGEEWGRFVAAHSDIVAAREKLAELSGVKS